MMLEDVHQRADHHRLQIDEVGISGIHYPVVVRDRDLGKQQTIAEVAMYVDLDAKMKGAHLSRFVEVLHEHAACEELSGRSAAQLARQVRARMHSRAARVEFRFPYFVRRRAPVSGAVALMDYTCVLIGECHGDRARWVLTVRVPVTSACPCSKAISDYGAHNQRGYVTIAVRPDPSSSEAPPDLWVEDLVDVAEASASAPVRALVKRPDERYLTMQAFDNPRFVEDIARNAAFALGSDPRVRSFSVEVVNDESIHNHAAFARIRSTRSSPVCQEMGGSA